jgi:hypothetical protein
VRPCEGVASERDIAQELDAVNAGRASARGPADIFRRPLAQFLGEKFMLRVSLIHQPGIGLHG